MVRRSFPLQWNVPAPFPLAAGTWHSYCLYLSHTHPHRNAHICSESGTLTHKRAASAGRLAYHGEQHGAVMEVGMGWGGTTGPGARQPAGRLAGPLVHSEDAVPTSRPSCGPAGTICSLTSRTAKAAQHLVWVLQQAQTRAWRCCPR